MNSFLEYDLITQIYVLGKSLTKICMQINRDNIGSMTQQSSPRTTRPQSKSMVPIYPPSLNKCWSDQSINHLKLISNKFIQ